MRMGFFTTDGLVSHSHLFIIKKVNGHIRISKID
jgi:hypothetical protein